MSERENKEIEEIDSNTSPDSLLDFHNVKLNIGDSFIINSKNIRSQYSDLKTVNLINNIISGSNDSSKYKTDKIQLRNETDFEGTGMINAWDQFASFSSRLIKVTAEYVVLEMVIDSEQRVIEEREFDISMFEGLKLKEGGFFKVNCYKRPREQRMSIIDGSGMVNAEDFPNINFDEYSDDDLFFE
jgi:hypothetical protein